jgi:hypothetical protein
MPECVKESIKSHQEDNQCQVMQKLAGCAIIAKPQFILLLKYPKAVTYVTCTINF